MNENGSLPTGDGEEIPEDLIDPSEVVDDQDQLMFAWKNMGGQDGGGTESIDLIERWLPGEDEHHGRTDISLNQARPMALAERMERMFPNIIGDGAARAVIDSIDDYQQLLTSWEGLSREQQTEVLKNMDTGSRRGGEDAGALERLLGGGDD
jgi:hypothetical protein